MRASYPTYKSTSIPWLPEIPEHWELRRNKYLLKEINERSLRGEEDLLSVSQYTGVTLKKDRLENEGDLLTTASTLEGYKIVRKDDLVINIMLAWNGSLGVSDYDGIASPAYCVYRFGRNINPKYYHYLFRTDFMKLYFRSVSSGVIESRLRMYTDDFYRLYSFLPPLPEQTAIANYLDAKSEQINRFIAKKEKLIALLKEQKQAVINELLEDKEGKWERRKLKYFCKVKNGFAFDANTYIQDGVQIIKIGNLYRNELCLDRDPSFVDINLFESLKDFQVKREDILISLTGTLGKRDYGYAISVNSDQKLLLNQRVAKLIPDDRLILKEYFLYALWSNDFLDQIYSKPAGTKQANLGNEMILNTYVKLPDLKNQKVVINLINKNVGRINEAIERVEKEIEKVKELKQSLIAEVVTGRIKVA